MYRVHQAEYGIRILVAASQECTNTYSTRRVSNVCSADGSTHTESNKLYRKVKHRSRPNLSSRQRPKRAPIRRRSRRRQRRGELHTKHGLRVLLAQSHSGIDEKRPTDKFVTVRVEYAER